MISCTVKIRDCLSCLQSCLSPQVPSAACNQVPLRPLHMRTLVPSLGKGSWGSPQHHWAGKHSDQGDVLLLSVGPGASGFLQADRQVAGGHTLISLESTPIRVPLCLHTANQLLTNQEKP